MELARKSRTRLGRSVLGGVTNSFSDDETLPCPNHFAEPHGPIRRRRQYSLIAAILIGCVSDLLMRSDH
jgi:hypothetical protein